MTQKIAKAARLGKGLTLMVTIQNADVKDEVSGDTFSANGHKGGFRNLPSTTLPQSDVRTKIGRRNFKAGGVLNGEPIYQSNNPHRGFRYLPIKPKPTANRLGPPPAVPNRYPTVTKVRCTGKYVSGKRCCKKEKLTRYALLY